MEALVSPADASLLLTEQEQMFVYQREVIGLSVNRAAEVAGVSAPYALMKKPHIIAAMDQTRLAIRGRTNFTREDIVAGLHEAVEQAKLLGDPMAQIAGWREMSKLLGYDKQVNVNLHLTGSVEQVQKQLAGMSMEQLLEQAGDTNVMDGDFYRVADKS